MASTGMASTGRGIGDRIPPAVVAGICLVVLVLVAFQPVLTADWAPLDDDFNFLQNTRWRGLGPDTLLWMWTEPFFGHYMPVTWMSLALDHALWGLDPRGYHATNLVVYALAVLVLARISALTIRLTLPDLRDTRRWSAAALGTALFAVHPLRVESVAWITERRDVLALLFMLGSVEGYLRSETAPSPEAQKRWRTASVALLVLGLLSKAVAVTVPCVLLILDVLPLRRIRGWADLPSRAIDKWPWILGAAAFVPVAFWAQHVTGVDIPLEDQPPSIRLAKVFRSLVFYLHKTVVPSDLSPLYELHPEALRPALDVGVILVLGALAWALRHRAPALVLALVAYAVVLFPNSGIVAYGPHLVADRYATFSIVPLAVAGSVLLARLVAMEPWRRITHGLATALVALLATLTIHQSSLWSDPETFWENAYRIEPHSAQVVCNYGLAKIKLGRAAEAIPLLERCLEMRGNANNAVLLGSAYASAGQWERGLDLWSSIPAGDPLYPRARFLMGLALVGVGQRDAAVGFLEEAKALAPGMTGLDEALEEAKRAP